MPADRTPAATVLVAWLRLQAGIDGVAALAFLVAPAILTVVLPDASLPFGRLVGVEAAALAAAYGFASRGPAARPELLLVGNLVRGVGGVALLASLVGDAALPWPMRLGWGGEFAFLAITVALQRRAGLPWGPS